MQQLKQAHVGIIPPIDVVVKSLYFTPNIRRPRRMPPQPFLSVERSQCGMTVQASEARQVFGASAEASQDTLRFFDSPQVGSSLLQRNQLFQNHCSCRNQWKIIAVSQWEIRFTTQLPDLSDPIPSPSWVTLLVHGKQEGPFQVAATWISRFDILAVSSIWHLGCLGIQ